MPIYKIRDAVARKIYAWGRAVGKRGVGDKKGRMSESRRETVGCDHSFDKLKGLEAEKSDMSAGTALHPKLQPVETRLQALADAPAPLTPAHLELIREAGLEDEEVRSLVSGDLGNNLKNLAGLLAQCFRLYGPEGGLRWLHQPIARFGQRSPLRFLESTADFNAVDEYLVQITEGYFA